MESNLEGVRPCPLAERCGDDVEGIANRAGIGRRDFLVRGALAAAAAALAACGAPQTSTAPSGVSLTLNVANYPALANTGGVVFVTSQGTPLAIVRTSDTAFVALSRVCPHQGGIVGQSGSSFVCPIHGAQFSLTGAWIGGQPTSNMRAYPTAFNSQTGVLTVG